MLAFKSSKVSDIYLLAIDFSFWYLLQICFWWEYNNNNTNNNDNNNYTNKNSNIDLDTNKADINTTLIQTKLWNQFDHHQSISKLLQDIVNFNKELKSSIGKYFY